MGSEGGAAGRVRRRSIQQEGGSGRSSGEGVWEEQKGVEAAVKGEEQKGVEAAVKGRSRKG